MQHLALVLTFLHCRAQRLGIQTFAAAKVLLFIQLCKFIAQKIYFFMQYDEFIAQNRSIQHNKSCPVIGVGILQIQKAQRFDPLRPN